MDTPTQPLHTPPAQPPPTPVTDPPQPAPPPGGPYGEPPPAPATPATLATQPGRRRVWVRLLAAVCVAALAATPAFLLARGAGDLRGSGPVTCENRWRCIPALDVDDVVQVLEEQGFDCDSSTASLDVCLFQLGSYHYRVLLGTPYGLISHYTVEVYHPQRPTTPHVEAALVWFATLPFAGDPDAAAATRQWTTEHLHGGQDQSATVRGYTFTLTLTEPTHLTLTLDLKDR